ncbi:C40 family peptidase [Allorhizocola rhizosphaerae]|uniref:C40 family peptidase n=1 Tax=Allorhizocola rhizosphaerae TaxID=1872709 RepID=UPI000E3D80B9|nr:NlpC/P60 family protein [Allorhizocola rhizosphaerae]
MRHRGIPRLRATLRSLIPAGALCIGILVSTTAAHAEPTVAELEQQISEKSHDLELVVEQYNKLNEQLAATQAEITNLQSALPTLEQRAAQAQERVGDIAQTAYQTGGINGLSALLGGNDGRAALERLGTLSQLAHAQQEQINAARETAAKHETARKALEQRRADEQARAQLLDNQRKGIEAELDQLNQLKLRARGTTTNRTGAYTGKIPQISGQAGAVVAFAYNAIGTPYVWAADGPDGYDCSGLTKAAWAAAGVSLAHYTVTQWEQTTRISRADLQPGDLVFYSGLGHVALYVGDGQVIHAPTFGESVKLSSVDMMTPYGYGRVG